MYKVFLFFTIVLILSVWAFIYTQIVFNTLEWRDIMSNVFLGHGLVTFTQMMYLEITPRSKTSSFIPAWIAIGLLVISCWGGLVMLASMYCCK